MPEFPKPVFITGASGWIGRRILRALLEQPVGRHPQVYALVMPGEPTRDLLELGAEVVQGDIRDPSSVASFLERSEGGIVIHLAGVIHPPDKRVQTFFDVNVRGAQNVLHAASARRARRIVAMSSNSPFGANLRRDALFDEEAPYRPYMAYGRSKQMMEELFLGQSGSPTGPEIVVVRAPWFYGPGQPGRQTRFFNMIRAGRFPIVGDGENLRSMAYVDNLASGVLLAATATTVAGQTYWIADERPYSMNEIVQTVRSVLADDFGLAVNAKAPRVPGLVADAARLADWTLQKVGLYQQEIHVLSETNLTIACSVNRAQRDLGYVPEISLREGMKRSVQWCLDKGIAI